MRIHKLSPQEWSIFSEQAHLLAFDEIRPFLSERIDYALLATSDENKPMGYVTVRELDDESVYWQFGGSFPETRGSMACLKGYRAFLDWHKERYARVATLIENTNIPMLKMAMKVGFLIVGVKNVQGKVLLEHSIEFKRGADNE